MIKAVVGSGGKSTWIRVNAERERAQGKNVFVTTTTHMSAEPDARITEDADAIIREMEETGYVKAGSLDGFKLAPLTPETYYKVSEKADVVLIEADGSFRLPIKFPNATEPVIPGNVDEIVVICGVKQALGRPAKEVAHRLELVKACLGIEDDTIIRPEHIQTLVRKGYLEPLRAAYPDVKIAVEPTIDGSLYQRALAALLKADLDVSLIKEEWFASQPTLFLCGGGHVAYEVSKMAAMLDFRVVVMDDREAFANPERFPWAAKVICDSFANLDQYLEPGAYYCVLTRGHKDDYDCVRAILPQPYTYLGMIGSRGKVQTTFDNLRREGVSEDAIKTIHAPIGLPIRAVTPAEIAVSILGEIIQVKNGQQTASVSRELLDVQEAGTLCLITEKHGSGPRGAGSMMFVSEEQIIGTVGGGSVEYAVQQQAKARPQAMIKEYDLSPEDVENLGMICGGRCKVLFLPV